MRWPMIPVRQNELGSALIRILDIGTSLAGLCAHACVCVCMHAVHMRINGWVRY